MTPQRQVPLTWQDLLSADSTPEAVMSTVRDFLATWHPSEVASMPANCVPPANLRDPDEVLEYAFQLARCDQASGERNYVLSRFAVFFAQASQRLAQMMELDPDDPANSE